MSEALLAPGDTCVFGRDGPLRPLPIRIGLGALAVAGLRLDNLVQIGHNIRPGQCCVVVPQSGIAGPAVLRILP